MKTKIELEQEIIALTSKIQQEYPEIAKFIPEMRDNNSGRKEVNIETLEEYHQSLLELIRNYVKSKKK